jgi:flavin-dependent dehydrogenase
MVELNGNAMHRSFDVTIIGGGFAGAATGLLLKRKCPRARVLILEKAPVFTRKVGESTTEVSSCFLTRVLGLSTYLGHEQLAKQGLRMWFSNANDQPFEQCVEMGARYNSRLSGFQVDRAKLDEHLLGLAEEAGCEVWRPAKVLGVELGGVGKNVIRVSRVNRVSKVQGETEDGRNGKNETHGKDGNGAGKMQEASSEESIVSQWVVDASGRVALLGRKLGLFKPLSEHPTNTIWARFTGVKDWDGIELREKYPNFAKACRTARSWATNHLMGLGWWVWIIPLKGGDTSIGLVYDSRLYSPPEGASPAERLKAHFLKHPIGRELLGEAQAVEHDIWAYSALPYCNQKIMGEGWAMVGDAAGFIDPFYSPGLDFCSFTSHGAHTMIARSLTGELVDRNLTEAIESYNARFAFCFRSWFEGIYRDKYYYLGDAELMAAAFLLDIANYHLGPVRQVYQDPETQFSFFPFDGMPGRIAAKALAFYNGRLVTIARKKIQAGSYGDRNANWRLMVPGFVPEPTVLKLFRQGLFRWWKAELRALFKGLHHR